MDTDRRVLKDAGIAVRDSAIVDIDTRENIESKWDAKEKISAAEYDIVLPGLINGHTHSPMTLLRGIADDFSVVDWLVNYIWPAEAKTITPEFSRIGTQIAAMEMIRTGTTTFCDMYFFPEESAKVVDEIGMRAIIPGVVIDFPTPEASTPAEALDLARTHAQNWKDHPRVTPAVAAHAPNTVSPDNLVAVADLARELAVPISVHLAETQDEVNQIQERFGKTPVEFLADLGFLGPDVIAAHSIWLTDNDIELLLNYNTTLIHATESNAKLVAGTMRLIDILESGLTVGLATDGPATNNNLDMFEAMSLASLHQKNSLMEPTVMPAEATLEMATIIGARALKMDHIIGSLEIGKQADIIIIDGNSPNMVPQYNVYSATVYSAGGGNVRATIVAGAPLYLDGQYLTLDPEMILDAAREQAIKLWDALNEG